MFVGNKGEGEKGDYKGVQRNFWDDGYNIHYLDDSDGFMGEYIRENISNCILRVCTIYYVSYTSINLLKINY